jgi:type II restriction enzyme
VIVVPHFAFSLSAVECRKPLSPNARRAGWIGCNIVLANLPADAKIPIVKDGVVQSVGQVRLQYAKLRPLEKLSVETRGWTLDVLNAARSLHKTQFSLTEAYSRELDLARLHPQNRHIRDNNSKSSATSASSNFSGMETTACTDWLLASATALRSMKTK